jgi:uncharacterized protein (TIGR02145 family)
MKRFLFLIVFFCVSKANAQNYLISFAGTGASATVETIKVENLTRGTILTFNGSDILRLTTTTGIIFNEDSQLSELKIYPNPMTDFATLEIFPPVEGNAIISILNMEGKSVYQIQSYLENSRQDFRLSGIKSGFYLITVKGNSYQYSVKLLSNGEDSNGTIKIENVNKVTKTIDISTEKTESKGIKATIDMEYTSGERLKFTGISGNYSTVKVDIPTQNKTITFNFIACADGDNNMYSVVELGTQIWMAENLKTTVFNNQTPISIVTNNTTWSTLSTPAYCWYSNNGATYKSIYGAMYNWFAVNTGNLCPTGWHIPTDGEFNTLELYLGMPAAQVYLLGWRGTDHGSQLKSTSGWSGSGNGTNASGFSALSGGYRHVTDGSFSDLTNLSYWWTPTADGATTAWYRRLDGNNNGVYRAITERRAGMYVRCVHD